VPPPLSLSVYLETTIPSYLASRPSRDLVTAAHQQITHEWWNTAKTFYRLYVSEAVIDEIRGGDPEIAVRRLQLVEDLPILEIRDDILELVEIYGKSLGLPDRAQVDLVHIAFAVAYDIDYLVTWNCKHIANGSVIRRLSEINRRLQRPTPVIVTPEELEPTSIERGIHDL
jgi:predicted nucleic acid-binding protein